MQPLLARISTLITGQLPATFTSKDWARIIAINSFALIITPVFLVYAVIFYQNGQYSILTAIVALILLCLIPLLLNFLGRYELAKDIYTFQAPLFVLLYALYLGKDFGIQYFFILLYAYPFIFFANHQFRRTLIFFIYNSLCLLYFEFGSLEWIPPAAISEEMALAIRITIHVIIFVFCTVLFFALYQNIVKSATELEKTNLEVEKAYNMKRDFLATMSHELRTPLNAVVTITTLLDDNPNRKDKTKLLGLLKFSSNNLLSIINDILDFSKLEVSKIKLDNRPHYLGKFLHEVKDTYKNMSDEKGLAFKLTVDEDLAEIYKMDDVKFGQILGNLIGNAIKFTDSGSVGLGVTKIGERGYKDMIRFEIQDTGPGIHPSEINSIFESFSQSRSITTRRKDGTGLGLAIVKRLLNLYDSDIQVESELHKGSIFSFEVALKKGGKIARLEEQSFDQLNDKRILLVEDNAINSMVAEKLLAGWGISSIKAVNGEQAVDLCLKEEYDLILMDLHMPVMDGFNAAKKIREQENINMYTPIFALTADVTGESNRSFNKYFDGFLTKPIQKEKLQKLLVSQLS